MTEDEMRRRIDLERRHGEDEKRRAVARTILSIVGVVGFFLIMSKYAVEDTATQWKGMILLVAMIVALVWIYKLLTERE